MFNSDNSGFTMPVMPAYGGNSGGNGSFLGGDGIWAILLFALLFGNGGWGFGGMGGFGGMMGMGMMDGFGLYPWLNNSEHISDGFRDQQLSNQIQGIQSAVTSGFGDVQLGIAGVNQNICQTGNSVVNAVTGAQSTLATQLYNNEIASLNRSFAEQSANTAAINGVSTQIAGASAENRLGVATLGADLAREACADRTAAAQNTRDIIDAVRSGNQALMDKLCALELDGVKNQLAQAQRENVGLQNQLNMASFKESQAAQNAFIQQGLTNEVDALYNRLSNCPVPTTPVYGRTPIFTCNGNNGCGCNGNFYN